MGIESVFKAAADAMESAPVKGKGKPGRPKKADPFTEAISDPTLCEFAVRIPFSIGATFAALAPEDVRGKLVDLWALDDESAKVGGLALRALILKRGGWIAEHLPELVLGTVLGIGFGGRGIGTVLLLRQSRANRKNPRPLQDPQPKPPAAPATE